MQSVPREEITGTLQPARHLLKADIAKHPLPAGYSVIYDGQMKTFNEQNEAFSAAFGLAFVFIFMVLASQARLRREPAPAVPLHSAVAGEGPAKAANG